MADIIKHNEMQIQCLHDIKRHTIEDACYVLQTKDYFCLFLTTVNVSSSVSASLLVLRSTGTSCIRDSILAAAFLFASFFEVPLPGEEQEIK